MGIYKEGLNRKQQLMFPLSLTPSYKTITNFRKNNPKALQTIFREFSLPTILKDY